MSNDTRSFPIQATSYRDEITDEMVHETRCTIPWWLAEEAYKYYVELFGKAQSLERLAERSGFGRRELLKLLRKDKRF